MGILIYALLQFINIFIYLLIARAILSWFPINSYGLMYKLRHGITMLTEPIVMPFRKLLARYNTGMFDFSVMLAMVALMMLQRVIMMLAY